jgi:predicted Zn-dependent protease
MRSGLLAVGVAASLVVAVPARAQIGSLLKKAQQVSKELKLSDADEAELGADVSAKLRQKYGVVQDQAIHKYVTLVGTVLAQASSRPNLHWTFIVLDTDGVNAFAAPGGYIHITRGALALMQNESELACVLGHEISHVTEKHAINAIRKSKMAQAAADLAHSEMLQQVADQTYSILLENKYDRNDEKDADKLGIELANKVGYAPTGLSAFLTRLADRNKGLKDPSGLFASHPQTVDRLDTMAKIIASEKLAATATVAGRYAASVHFTAVPVTQLAMATGGPATPPSPEPTSGGGGGKFGLSGLNPLSREKSSSQTISSAGSRGVNPDRDAKGGPNKAIVIVTVTPAEVEAFRKGIVG